MLTGWRIVLWLVSLTFRNVVWATGDTACFMQEVKLNKWSEFLWTWLLWVWPNNNQFDFLTQIVWDWTSHLVLPWCFGCVHSKGRRKIHCGEWKQRNLEVLQAARWRELLHFVVCEGGSPQVPRLYSCPFFCHWAKLLYYTIVLCSWTTEQQLSPLFFIGWITCTHFLFSGHQKYMGKMPKSKVLLW